MQILTIILVVAAYLTIGGFCVGILMRIDPSFRRSLDSGEVGNGVGVAVFWPLVVLVGIGIGIVALILKIAEFVAEIKVQPKQESPSPPRSAVD